MTTGNSFQKRSTALEDEFFHRVDQQLMIQWKERQRQQLDEHALKEATGITDEHVLEELRNADVTPRTLVAFSLFPAVFVAWADGHVESAERDAVLKAAKCQGIFSATPCYELLESWLKKKPGKEVVSAWKDFIHAIRSTISDQAFREMRHAAMNRAEDIAKAAGGFLGLGSVSRSEKAALAELDEVFNHALESEESTE